MESLSLAQARRIALAAQGFRDPQHRAGRERARAEGHPGQGGVGQGERRPTMRSLTRAVRRTGVLQVDSVNVLQRAHFMPVYSRIGAYDVDLLHRAASGRRDRRLVEYWAHVQALMPVELWPHMQHRMDHYRARRGKWRVLEEMPELEASLLAEVRERGACTARDLDDGLPRRKDHWGWNWSATRRVLDLLFTTGDLAIAGRNSQFEIRYDLPERVIPPEVLALPTPSPADAHDELVRRAARSHGVATIAHLRDYYRMGVADTVAAVDRLTEAGELQPVRVDGWPQPAYLHHEARVPRKVRARALLSPFDPLVWERERTARLFGFRYRIEIYVPEHKREHGYYVLPFLLGDRLVARVDLKADRPGGVLLVKAAYAEADAPDSTAFELAAELRLLADWLGLSAVYVAPRGDLAPALSAHL